MQLLSVFASLLVALPLVASHGYLSSPPPRGIQQATTDVDALKSPNKGQGLCRGLPAATPTTAQPGESMTLQFTITAPHIGPCWVYLATPDFQTSRLIADKDNCAAPGQVGPWTITLPQDVQGPMVLRWHWQAQHVTPFEQYEQCVDLDFGGGGSGGFTQPTPPSGSSDSLSLTDAGDSQTASPTPGQTPPNGAPVSPASSAAGSAPSAPYVSGTASSDPSDPSATAADATDADPTDATDPTDPTDPTDADPTDADPTDADPTDADPTDADPTDADPTDADPTDADPASTTGSAPGSPTFGATPPSTELPPNSSVFGASPPGTATLATPGGPCTLGQYQCIGGAQFQQCSPSGWVTQSCAQGTVCQPNGSAILCQTAPTPSS